MFEKSINEDVWNWHTMRCLIQLPKVWDHWGHIAEKNLAINSFNITSPEIFAKYIDKLQNNKAVGYDGLKATFIKNIGPSDVQLSLRTI